MSTSTLNLQQLHFGFARCCLTTSLALCSLLKLNEMNNLTNNRVFKILKLSNSYSKTDNPKTKHTPYFYYIFIIFSLFFLWFVPLQHPALCIISHLYNKYADTPYRLNHCTPKEFATRCVRVVPYPATGFLDFHSCQC